MATTRTPRSKPAASRNGGIAEAVTAAPPAPPVSPPPAAAGGNGGAPPPPVHHVGEQKMSRLQRAFVGGGIVLAALLFVTQLIAIWPAVIAASSTEATPPPLPSTPILFGIWTPTFDADVVLILMVLIVGAAAALVGVSRRFLHFALRDQLTQRDEWSYVLRPFQGAILALIVYFTLRGGFLGQDATAPVNPYGVAAISGLVGLFTRHAVSKLTEVFDTVFGKPREETEPIEVHRDEEPSED